MTATSFIDLDYVSWFYRQKMKVPIESHLGCKPYTMRWNNLFNVFWPEPFNRLLGDQIVVLKVKAPDYHKDFFEAGYLHGKGRHVANPWMCASWKDSPCSARHHLLALLSFRILIFIDRILLITRDFNIESGSGSGWCDIRYFSAKTLNDVLDNG